jgi:ketosteroid isomerase-like protein
MSRPETFPASLADSKTVRLIQEMFLAIDNREWSQLARFFCSDVTYERPGYPTIFGIDELSRFYREVRIIVSGEHILGSLIADPNSAACGGRFIGIARDGRRLDERFADVYEIRDSRIASRTTYFYRAAI